MFFFLWCHPLNIISLSVTLSHSTLVTLLGIIQIFSSCNCCFALKPVFKNEHFKFLQGITMLILATDMARHAEIMESFKDKLAAGFDNKNKDHLDTVRVVSPLNVCRLLFQLPFKLQPLSFRVKLSLDIYTYRPIKFYLNNFIQRGRKSSKD